MQVAQIAMQGQVEGVAPASILARIEELTGPATDQGSALLPGPGSNAESWRRVALESRARHIKWMRERTGEERTVSRIAEWTEAELPRFRKQQLWGMS